MTKNCKDRHLFITLFNKKMTKNNGFIPEKQICICGNYKPKSTIGLIDDNCINCNGSKNPVILK